MNNTNYILNSSNYDSSTKSFKYNLPISQKFENKKVALSYISIYKQFFNISSEYGNNKFKIIWTDGTIYDITIPDGNYTVSQINQYLGFIQFQNKLYLKTNDNKFLFFIEVLVNATQYGCQLAFYKVPTSGEATTLNYTKPEGATWEFPASTVCPSLEFDNNFGSLIGFTSGTYGATNEDIIFESNLTPQIAKVNALTVHCNLINNENTNPQDVISALSMSGDFGDLIIYNAGYPLYSKITTKNYSYIEVYFSDQNLNKLSIRDTEVLIMLSVIDN